MAELDLLALAAPARVLAFGAYLKNRACRVDGRKVRWSAPHGDLGDAVACMALDDSIARLHSLAGRPIEAVAHDLHPDFPSTRAALALAERVGVPAIAVQHHHAHVAAVQAEWGLREPVVGIALDGVGLGTDGSPWGGELLWVGGDQAAHRWRRLAHLRPLALPGGDAAAREPWRMAAAVLHDLGRADEIESRFGPVVGIEAARTVRAMLVRQLNCPVTSSAGRWFDAAAGALGLSVRQAAEAEAAISLEWQAEAWLQIHPGFDVPWPDLDLRPVVATLFDVERADAAAVARAAATFHVALANGLARSAIDAASALDCSHVVLSGGCFTNRVLCARLGAALRRAGLQVHAPRRIPCGDAGLALGQAWVAARAIADAAKGDRAVACEMEGDL